jgi:hypothetical protein
LYSRTTWTSHRCTRATELHTLRNRFQRSTLFQQDRRCCTLHNVHCLSVYHGTSHHKFVAPQYTKAGSFDRYTRTRDHTPRHTHHSCADPCEHRRSTSPRHHHHRHTLPTWRRTSVHSDRGYRAAPQDTRGRKSRSASHPSAHSHIANHKQFANQDNGVNTHRQHTPFHQNTPRHIHRSSTDLSWGQHNGHHTPQVEQCNPHRLHRPCPCDPRRCRHRCEKCQCKQEKPEQQRLGSVDQKIEPQMPLSSHIQQRQVTEYKHNSHSGKRPVAKSVVCDSHTKTSTDCFARSYRHAMKMTSTTA